MRAWAVVVIALLGGCTSGYQSFTAPPLDFSGRQPLRLAVDRVTVDSAYRAVGPAPALPLNPEEATRALLEQRLRAVGGTDRLQAVILDAAVQEQALETTAGVRGWLTTESAARLEGRIEVRIDLLDPTGTVIRSTRTAVVRTRALPEDVAYAERQRIAYELVRDLVDDLDVGLSANVRESYADLLRR